MSYSPPTVSVQPMISAFLRGVGTGIDESVAGSAPGSGSFEFANRAVYYPVVVPGTCAIRRVWWANGSSVSASYNVDVGVYADTGAFRPGARLVSSGSTAQGTASQIQFVDVTDTSLGPGRYWIAIACSSTSSTFFRSNLTSGVYGSVLRLRENGALPLPSTATPDALTVDDLEQQIYLFGFATTASP